MNGNQYLFKPEMYGRRSAEYFRSADWQRIFGARKAALVYIHSKNVMFVYPVLNEFCEYQNCQIKGANVGYQILEISTSLKNGNQYLFKPEMYGRRSADWQRIFCARKAALVYIH